MPITPPGLNFMRWLQERTTLMDDPYAGMRQERVPGEVWSDIPTRPSRVEQMTGVAGQSLPWVPGAMGVETPPEEAQAYAEKPYLAKLGGLAGMSIMGRGGIGAPGPKWLRTTPETGPTGEAIRPSVTPQLLTAATAGDEAAKAKVVDALQNMVAKAAHRYVKPGRPTAEFEDLMAEGNIAVMQVLNKEKQPQAFLPYVQAAIDKRLQAFTRGQRRAGRGQMPIEGQALEDISARIPDVPRQEMNVMLNEIMTKIPAQQKKAVEAYLGLGEFPPTKNFDELGVVLGMSKKNAHKNVMKGMDKLRTELKARGIDPADIAPETQTAPPTRLEKPVEEAIPPAPVTVTKPELGGLARQPRPYTIKGLQTPGGNTIYELRAGDTTMDFFIHGDTLIVENLRAPKPSPADLRAVLRGLKEFTAKTGTKNIEAQVINPKLAEFMRRSGIDVKSTAPEAKPTTFSVEQLSGQKPTAAKPLPANPQQAIESLGLKYEGATPGLNPGDPEMHWWSEMLPSGEKGTTGLIRTGSDYEDLIKQYAKPIAGGSGPELSGLGKGLAARGLEQSQAGGFHVGMPPEHVPGGYEASWPSEAAATVEAAGDMSLGGAPGSYLQDLQRDPEAIRRFLQMLDQYNLGAE